MQAVWRSHHRPRLTNHDRRELSSNRGGEIIGRGRPSASMGASYAPLRPSETASASTRPWSAGRRFGGTVLAGHDGILKAINTTQLLQIRRMMNPSRRAGNAGKTGTFTR